MCKMAPFVSCYQKALSTVETCLTSGGWHAAGGDNVGQLPGADPWCCLPMVVDCRLTSVALKVLVAVTDPNCRFILADHFWQRIQPHQSLLLWSMAACMGLNDTTCLHLTICHISTHKIRPGQALMLWHAGCHIKTFKLLKTLGKKLGLRCQLFYVKFHLLVTYTIECHKLSHLEISVNKYISSINILQVYIVTLWHLIPLFILIHDPWK